MHVRPWGNFGWSSNPSLLTCDGAKLADSVYGAGCQNFMLPAPRKVTYTFFAGRNFRGIETIPVPFLPIPRSRRDWRIFAYGSTARPHLCQHFLHRHFREGDFGGYWRGSLRRGNHAESGHAACAETTAQHNHGDIPVPSPPNSPFTSPLLPPSPCACWCRTFSPRLPRVVRPRWFPDSPWEADTALVSWVSGLVVSWP